MYPGQWIGKFFHQDLSDSHEPELRLVRRRNNTVELMNKCGVLCSEYRLFKYVK